jgi:hypothetical protein
VVVGSRYGSAVPYRPLSAFVLTVAAASAAAPAQATPRPLTPGFGGEIAPAGEQILMTRIDGANLRVVAIPVTGGPAREVFSFDVPDRLHLESAELAASPQRGALAITMVKSFRDTIRAVQPSPDRWRAAGASCGRSPS